MTKSQALAAVASSARLRLVGVLLRGSIIIALNSRRNTKPDFDEIVFVCWVVCKASCPKEAQNGLTEDRYVDLGRNFDENIFLPLFGLDQVADRKGDVGRVVLFVLFEDDVPPSLVEISACHIGVVESLEDGNLSTGYLYFFSTPSLLPELALLTVVLPLNTSAEESVVPNLDGDQGLNQGS